MSTELCCWADRMCTSNSALNPPFDLAVLELWLVPVVTSEAEFGTGTEAELGVGDSKVSWTSGISVRTNFFFK